MPHPDKYGCEIAYAKINLALHIRERRDDGYHALESLFIFAEDGDRLSGMATDDGAVDLVIDGPFGAMLDTGPGNLVIQAARALQSYLGEQRGAALRLTKALPLASGIGGGSADAAATLRLLVRLWDVRIEQSELVALALGLGSDVPACVASVTQLVRGRGDRIDRIDRQEGLGLAGCPMLLVNPGVPLSTKQVFAGWDRVDRGALDVTTLQGLVRKGRNDLEAPAITLAPVIGDVLAVLQCCGKPRLVRMSGSGATCFALFDTVEDRTEAGRAVGTAHPDWWVMETRIRAG